MAGFMGAFAVLYSILILFVCGFVLTMIFRFVKAVEKIATVYEKKNTSA